MRGSMIHLIPQMIERVGIVLIVAFLFSRVNHSGCLSKNIKGEGKGFSLF
ncbi:hypothetical protein [Rossellomorea marisflavi]